MSIKSINYEENRMSNSLDEFETIVYPVVGVTFDNRQEILQDFYDRIYKVGGEFDIRLVKEDQNKYDSNAIAVMLAIDDEYKNIGYIAKTENSALRESLPYIQKAKVRSMGYNYKGVLGVSIIVYIKKG